MKIKNSIIYFTLIVGGIIFLPNHNSAKAVTCGDFQPGTCRPSCLTNETQIPDSSVSPVCSPINQVCCAPAPTPSASKTTSSSSGGQLGDTCKSSADCSGNDNYCLAIVNNQYVDISEAPSGSQGWCMPSSALTEQSNSQDTASPISSNPGLPTPAPVSPSQTPSAPVAPTPSSNQIQTEPTIPSIPLPNPPGGIQEVLLNILQWLLQIVGIIALISFIISGIQYFTAAGEESKAESAKRNVTYSVIGVIVVTASFLIVQAIQNALAAKTIF